MAQPIQSRNSGSMKLPDEKPYWDMPRILAKFFRTRHFAIARSTDERAAIACIFPPGRFCADTAQTTREYIPAGPLLFLAGVFNSFVVDWELRLRITTHADMHFVYAMRIPRLTESDPAFSPIVSRVARIICTTPEFDDLAKEVGIESHKEGVTDPAERARLRAELDGLIAHLYGLTEDEFAYILTTFLLVAQPIKDAALRAYKDFAPKPGGAEVAALIAAGESAVLEFKSSARWDMKENRVNKMLQQVIVKTVAAFLNSENGGTLLIGVDDDGKITGLAHDYRTLGKKQNRDGYENWLTTLLLGEYGKDSAPLIKAIFHEVDGKDICRVIAKSSPRPIYVRDGADEHLYIRAGNSTRQLTTKEAVDYCKHRWP